MTTKNCKRPRWLSWLVRCWVSLRLRRATRYADFCLGKIYEAQDMGHEATADIAVYREAVAAEYRWMRKLRDLSPNGCGEPRREGSA